MSDNRLKAQGFVEVDLLKKGKTHDEVRGFLSSGVIGQDRAVEHVARAIQRKKFKDPNLPVATFLFAGPTGVGKTEMAKVIAKYFIGNVDPAPLIHIDCQNYQQAHEVSALIGAPQGYLGYDSEPRLTQKKINEPYFKTMRQINKKYAKDIENAERSIRALKTFLDSTKHEKMYERELMAIGASIHQKYGEAKSVILFDEIEKAHDRFWDFVINIVAEGKMIHHNPMFGDVSFANSIIIFTTNVGARDVQNILTGNNNIGFGRNDDEAEDSNQKIYNAVKKALEKTFKPEFLGRIKENIVVFHPLKTEDQMKVLHVQLGKVQKRFSKLGMYLKWHFTDEFRKFVLQKASDNKYGMRVLSQKIEKYVESPVCGAIETDQVKMHDELIFDVQGGKIKLWVKGQEKSTKAFHSESGYDFGHR